MLLVNIIHVNTIAMNKIKNIYRSLILLLSLVLMPVEGWASDGYFAGTTPIVIKLSDYIMDQYDYACFYFDRNGSKLDISGWNIYNDNLLNHEIKGVDWDGHRKDNNYVFYDKSKVTVPIIFANLFQYKVDSKSENLHQTKLVLLLSNNPDLEHLKENLAGVKKMEFDLYTEDGLKSSKVTYGSNSADFSKAESTCIIPTAATSTSVTLPDYKAKYLRWQLFDSETATTPVARITDILSNSSSVEKGSDLIFFNATDFADDEARTVSFDFSKLPEGADVEKYVLKCTWANNDNDDAKVVTYNGKTYILQEPTLNGEYTFKFVRQETVDATSLVLSADNVDAAHTHQVDAIYTDGKLEISLKDVVPDILSDFGVADKKDVSDFYMRWVLADKDGKILSATSSNSALALRKTSDGKEYYTLLSKKGSSLLPTGLNVTFGLPSGFSWSSDMQVYCLLSNDLTGHEAQYGVITKEPSAFKSRINVKLYSPEALPFKHYEGIANKKGDWDIVNGNTYQKTHEWEYYYYVDATDNQVLLKLPIQNYTGNSNDLEPRGYYRWYNYDTDEGSDNLVACGDATHTKLYKKGNWGLFANNIGTHPTSTLIGVNYNTSHVNDSWKGETIACDVSRYVDGMDASRTYLLHEPTLSIRYIFHILPKKKLADDIKAALCNYDDGNYTYEDNKKVTFGFKDNNSVTTLRLQLNDIQRYAYYPMTSGGLKKNVYVDKITEADFDTSSGIKKPWNVVWRIYDITKTYYCEVTSTNANPRFFDLSIDAITKSTVKWQQADGTEVSTPKITKGSPIYVVAYLSDNIGSLCPVANFDVRFMEFHPMTHDQITAAGYNNRTISYLDEHYKLATKPISFDDDDDEQTLAKPTSPDDNQDRLPSRWDRRAYSFVYRDLIDYDATGYRNPIGHSPLHGDYGLYKTANLTDISGNGDGGTDKYVWWTDKKLYDRTYEMTKGSQYGHFLYVDASNESRQIAAADFKADLCTGMQVIFSANVADMTHADELPQVMFKLYGVNYDAEGNIQSQKLLHSFSSGDFKNNTEDNPCLKATWYQVYGKIIIQKESGVENYSDFRVVIDNYCQNTDGADYAIDDIRIYIEPAKVQVIQDRPACGEAATGNIKLKIRAVHETLNAILNHTNTKIYFKFVDEDGNSVKGDGFYSYTLTDDADNTSTVTGSDYGTVNVYDSEETCKKYYIDGTSMIEQDSEGETYIVISNKYFPLTVGKKYYVSVATEDPESGKANWGSPAEVCSLYSNWFEMVSQHPIITDAKGNIVTDYKIPCDKAGSYSVTIKGQLVTTDPNRGGKITLDGVKFIWYIDDPAVATNKLNETASNEITISKDKLPLGVTHNIFMKPEGTPNADGYIPYPLNGKTYLLCTSAIPVPLRVMKDGPQLNFGFNDVDYPFNDGSYAASLRIGLPQLKKLKNTGFLEIPLHSATTGDGKAITSPLTFVDDSGTSAFTSDKVMVASTNDPSWKDKLNTQVATLQSTELPAIDKTTQATLNLMFSDAALENFHEGYYYELRFAFEQRKTSEATTNCAGESYLKLKIVPEFVTWTPTADGGMNANWNNDANWHRSSSTELYDNGYPNYQAYGNASGITAKIDIPTQNSYVPMKFTKVTIGNLNGLPFPDLGNVVYRSTNQIATKLTNGKGNEATKYIQYDIMAYWDEAAANKGLESGNLKCEKFYGNTCHQIYFKPQGELRDQCYLVYDKAWVEKELVPNKWYTMASPLQYIYAGDMYVPAKDGRQETPAFTDIKFDDKATDGTAVYSRSKYPIYQRAWMKSEVEEIITPTDKYSASHYPTGSAPSDVDMNLGYWSHVYNKVDELYAADGTFGGFSIKAGNALLPKDQTKKALLRLPKADNEYQYLDYKGATTSSSKTSVTKDPKGHGKLLVAFNNDEKHLAEKIQILGTDNTSGFYLVANPYTCSISMAKFFEANTDLQNAIWIVENGEVKAVSSTELGKQNYAIQPTQSFFVKKKDGKTVEDVRFTSTMCVDRTITPGLLMASDYVKSIEATTENSNGQTSKARIALRPEASADYDDQEDVDLLYDQNLKDVPQVYTVAGKEAVAVNAVPELSWIPLGIVSQQAEEVSLTLKGVNKLEAPVYLYDAASASFTELHEGEAVKVKAGDHGRYFLTQTRTSTGIDRMEAEEQSAPVKVYSPAAGMIVVTALGGEKLDKVQVFTMDGKMVHSYQLPDKQRMILRVPSGIYIVKASTQSCAQAKGQKIAVR